MAEHTRQKILEIPGRDEEIDRIPIFLEQLQDEWNISEQDTLSLNLVLEEAVINIINYGFVDQADHLIELTFTLEGNELSVTIADDGIAFDPTGHPEPDITLSADERPVGGLGIHLIRKLMDSVEYERKNEYNYLKMVKRIKL